MDTVLGKTIVERAMRRLTVVLLMLIVVVLPAGSLSIVGATDHHIAVVYPDVREPFSTVFRNIIDGVEGAVDSDLLEFEIASESTVDELAQFLERERPSAVVALGHRGLDLVQKVDPRIPIIAGGALLSPRDAANGVSGITFTADPEELFASLRSVDPTVRRVVTVYNPEHSGWLMEAAQDASSKLGIKLIAKPASDLRQALAVYDAIFADRDLKGAALWLPQDPSTVDSRTILPKVLSESWDQNRLVFSSLLGHVPRGVLFALYPDNEAMGRSLGELAMRRISNNSSNGGIKPLKDLKFAINLRTADHLGLSFSKEQEKKFDLTFPAR